MVPVIPTLVVALTIAFASLGGLEDGVNIFGDHVHVAAYAREDRRLLCTL
jgi:hypothetical protein